MGAGGELSLSPPTQARCEAGGLLAIAIRVSRHSRDRRRPDIQRILLEAYSLQEATRRGELGYAMVVEFQKMKYLWLEGVV